MSDPEGFLSRWARRKRAAAKAGEPATPDAKTPGSKALETEMDEAIAASAKRAPLAAEATTQTSREPATQAAPTVDLSALPSLESITAATDIRPFLAPGVPPELTRAALRRAWVADPQIRDFVGIAENQWDFTDPSAIPGFGPIGSLDDVRRMVAHLVGDEADMPPAPAVAADPHPSDMTTASAPAEPPAAVATASEPNGVENAQPPRQLADNADSDENAAAQNRPSDPPSDEVRIRRGHGGALPT